MNKLQFDPEKTLRGRWVMDSETNKKYLIDLDTNTIIAVWPIVEVKL
jgi:hypothetical protein